MLHRACASARSALRRSLAHHRRGAQRSEHAASVQPRGAGVCTCSSSSSGGGRRRLWARRTSRPSAFDRPSTGTRSALRERSSAACRDERHGFNERVACARGSRVRGVGLPPETRRGMPAAWAAAFAGAPASAPRLAAQPAAPPRRARVRLRSPGSPACAAHCAPGVAAPAPALARRSCAPALHTVRARTRARNACAPRRAAARI